MRGSAHIISKFAQSKLDVFFSRAILAAENKPSLKCNGRTKYQFSKTVAFVRGTRIRQYVTFADKQTRRLTRSPRMAIVIAAAIFWLCQNSPSNNIHGCILFDDGCRSYTFVKTIHPCIVLTASCGSATTLLLRGTTAVRGGRGTAGIKPHE